MQYKQFSTSHKILTYNPAEQLYKISILRISKQLINLNLQCFFVAYVAIQHLYIIFVILKYAMSLLNIHSILLEYLFLQGYSLMLYTASTIIPLS